MNYHCTRISRKETCGARPKGGLPEHFAKLAEHVGVNVVMLQSNTYHIVTSSFGMETPLTFTTGSLDIRVQSVSMGVQMWCGIIGG